MVVLLFVHLSEMTVLDYTECFISLNNLGTSEGVSWEALEVCYVELKEETEENLRVWLPCPIIKEFEGICFFVCLLQSFTEKCPCC